MQGLFSCDSCNVVLSFDLIYEISWPISIWIVYSVYSGPESQLRVESECVLSVLHCFLVDLQRGFDKIRFVSRARTKTSLNTKLQIQQEKFQKFITSCVAASRESQGSTNWLGPQTVTDFWRDENKIHKFTAIKTCTDFDKEHQCLHCSRFGSFATLPAMRLLPLSMQSAGIF